MKAVRFDYKKVLRAKYPVNRMLINKIEYYPGSSFLIGLDLLKHCANQTSMSELKLYIFLLGCRPYARYLANRELALPLELVPFSTRMLNNNGLLTIKQNKVFFKYEEETMRKYNNGTKFQ